jgi:uncharacterized membrane protein
VKLSKVNRASALLRSADRRNWIEAILLLVWLVLGMVLRFTNLDLKPASSIEISTMGYSLGHGFSKIPFDQIIPASTLLAPLQFDQAISYAAVFQRLMSESTHPPLYFWLTHWWIKLWVNNGELVSLGIGRSLSAIFGGLAVPAVFGLSWLAFRSRLAAHLAAILMAVSPYGVNLAQEARHYTLTILWVIASVACLIVAIHCINQQIRLPIWLCCLWILVNSLGVATHYFFILALSAEAMAIAIFWLCDRQCQTATQSHYRYWWRLGLVGLGTLIGCLVWLPVALGIPSNELTSWIDTNFALDQIFQPIPRLLAWVITMVMLLPVEGTPTIVTVISALVMLSLLIWAIPALIQGWLSQLGNQTTRLPMVILGSYFLGSIVASLVVIYGLGKDISLAARYHFVGFPIFILLIAVALAACWQGYGYTREVDSTLPNTVSISDNFRPAKNQKVVVVLLIIGLLSSLSVLNDYGFQKSRHSDDLAAYIQANSSLPAIVAMTHQTHSELRELIGLAFSFTRLYSQNQSSSQESLFSQLPEFLLVDQQQNLNKILVTQSKPLDLWGVNLKIDDENIAQLGCVQDTAIDLANSGYSDRLYHCH